MFDKHVHVHGGGDQHHYHRTEVHEHRAPTDASVKLLAEMEDKALARVLGTVRLQGCEVDCVVHHFRNVIEDADDFIVRYRLGLQQQRDVRHTFRSEFGEDAEQRRARCVQELVDALAQDLAAAMLRQSVAKSFEFLRSL